MSQKKTVFSFKFENTENQIRYIGNIKVMAKDHLESCPKVRVDIDISAYDLSKKKLAPLRRLQKKEVAYKQLFNATSKNHDPVNIMTTTSNVEATVSLMINAKGFTLHEIFIENYISPVVEKIREDYNLKKLIVFG